jgi:hypothetical protein
METATSQRERMASIAGTTREASSSAPTYSEPGRVLSPPTSMTAAPASSIPATVSTTAARPSGPDTRLGA